MMIILIIVVKVPKMKQKTVENDVKIPWNKNCSSAVEFKMLIALGIKHITYKEGSVM